MHPYQHQQHPSSQNGPSTSQQLLGSVESAASRFKRAFARKRPSRSGDQDGTESDWQGGRRNASSPRISTFMMRKDQPPVPQYSSSTYQPQSQPLYDMPSSSHTSAEVDQEGRKAPYFQAERRSDSSEVKPSTTAPIAIPLNTKAESRTSQQFLSSPGVSAAIEYILDPPSRISVSSAASKPGTTPESHTSHPTSSPKASPRRSVGNERSSSPINTVKRRSMSLSMIPNFASLTTSSTGAPPPSSFAKFTTSPYAPHQRSKSALPAHSGFVSPSLSETRLVQTDSASVTPSDSEPPHSGHSRGKLAPWTSSNSNLRSSRGTSPSHSKTSSVVATLDSAASAATGFAAQISRRAYEKVNSMLGPSSRPSSANNSSSRHGYETDAVQRLKTRPSANGPLGSQSDVETSRRKTASPAGEGPVGPKLGPMLRPPFRKVAQGGGLVFGRPLADCVRDTKPLVVLGDTAGVGIEARFIPALVLRCVQHLERWGITEEGLFRISGRSSHVNRLRIEFASGADYDLASCPPSDLDPHSVASVLKAYLRELPEPILTRNMAPLFDACFENAKQADFMNTAGLPPSNGFSAGGLPTGPRMGLPSGPRDGMPFPRSPNNNSMNQSTQPVVDETSENTSALVMITPQQALTALLEEYRSLVLALPRENRDLLLTINELLAKTAEHSRSNKMPLSNLLLVFCPSMGMNPGVLKVLVENHNFIFNEPNTDANRTDYNTLPFPPNTAKTSQFENVAMPVTHHPEAKDIKQEEIAAAPPPVVQDSAIAQNPSEHVIAHPPVRKQSLRRNAIDNQRPQVTPVSSPSAYKESFTSSGPDSTREISSPQPSTESPNRTNRSRTSPRPNSPLYQAGETVRPAGPRPPKHTPPPLSLRDSSSTSPSPSPRFIDHHNRKPSSSSLLASSGPGSAVASPAPFEMKDRHTGSSVETAKDVNELQNPPHNGSSAALTASNHSSEGVTVNNEANGSSPSASDEAVEINVQELPEVHPVPPMTSSFVQPPASAAPPLPTQVPQLPAIIYYPPSTIDDHSNDSIKVKTKQWAKHAKNSSSTSTVLAGGSGQVSEQFNVVSPNGTQAPLPAESANNGGNSDSLNVVNEVIVPENTTTQRSLTPLGVSNTSSQPLTPLLLALEKENAQGYDSRQQSNEDLTISHTRPEVKPLSLTKKWSASSGTQDQTDSGFYASSATSSATTTDTPQLLERLAAWPEVPKTVPNVYSEPSRSDPVLTANVPSLPADSGKPVPTVASNSSETSGQTIPQATATTTSSQNRNMINTIHPNYSGSLDRIAGPQIQPGAARRASSMSSDSTRSDMHDSNSNLNTARPVRAHAPRLTVNSKEMISGDSFWAMELQRVLQSASPTSQIESRLSGDWAAVHVTGDS